MAGLIACLNDNEGFLLKSAKQQNTNFNAYLKEALYESADRFNNPTAQHGYGIPNFETALYKYIGSTGSVEDRFFENLKIVPNPVINTFKIEGFKESLQDFDIQIFNVLGKVVYQQQKLTKPTLDISTLKKGLYLLRISRNNLQKTFKIIKQ